MKLYEVRCAHN